MSAARGLQLWGYRVASRWLPGVYARAARSAWYVRSARRRLISAALDRSQVPWTPLKRPLHQSTVALVTTGGIHLASQPPHGSDGHDPTYRAIPGDTPMTDLRVDQPHVDSTDARRDPNVLFPLARLRELAAEGAIGAIADTHFSFVGAIRDYGSLLTDTAPEMVASLQAQGVHLAILTPS